MGFNRSFLPKIHYMGRTLMNKTRLRVRLGYFVEWHAKSCFVLNMVCKRVVGRYFDFFFKLLLQD